MSGGATNINDLPSSNHSGSPPNITLHSTDNKVTNNEVEKRNSERNSDDIINSSHRAPPPNPNDYMKQVVSDVNIVSKNGGLQLPDRDIPSHQSHVQIDKASAVNYIPDGPDDYIKKYQTNEEVIQVNALKEKKTANNDYIYDELQNPLIIAVLYFVFQIPYVNTIILKNIPGLFKNDGNFNVKGYLFNSILFGSMFYLIQRVMQYIAE